jgi:hypothetical protein
MASKLSLVMWLIERVNTDLNSKCIISLKGNIVMRIKINLHNPNYQSPNKVQNFFLEVKSHIKQTYVQSVMA